MNYELYRVKSVQKAMQALKLFNNECTEISLSKLSKELGTHKSTAYRIAMTLCEEGFLRWNPTDGTYSLGLKILELSSTLLQSLELRTKARPYMEILNKVSGEFVHLGVRDKSEVVYVDKIEGNRGIRLYSEIGKRASCHCTALGKALLSGLSNQEVIGLFKNKELKPLTPNTIVSIPALLENLEEIRNKGYALDLEEHEPLVYCVAAPIKNYNGTHIASISITTIIKDFNESLLNKYIEATLDASAKVSAEMGYVSN